jgi:hypothetical protein
MQRIDRKKVERWPAGHHNPHKNLIIHYRGKRYELECGAGSDDSVSVFREGKIVFVLVVNTSLPYVGLDEYNLDDEPKVRKGFAGRFGEGDYASLEPVASIFGQEHQVEELLGPRGTDLTDATMVRRLAEHL